MSAEADNWDLEAAEYVLGTLSDEERKVYDALYKVDADWRARVHRWQTRLNPLHDSTAPVEPPEHVLSSLMNRINENAKPVTHATQAYATDGESTPSTRVVSTPVAQRQVQELSAVASTLNQWRERARYWQLATLVAVLSLVSVIVLGPDQLSQRIGNQNAPKTVAVLQSEMSEPLWAISYVPPVSSHTSDAEGTGSVSITAVGEPQLTAEQSHQLWMVFADGADVQSVGLVPDELGQTITLELPTALAEAAEFAVSLEPLGGVPGPEHGPVVTRTFIVQAPPTEM